MESTKEVRQPNAVRDKHFNDFTNLIRKLGLSSTHWDSKRFWPKWRELGHTSVDFKACACYKHHLEEN